MNTLDLLNQELTDDQLEVYQELTPHSQEVVEECIHTGSMAFVNAKFRDLLDEWTIKPEELKWRNDEFEAKLKYIKVLGVHIMALPGWDDVVKEMGQLYRIIKVLEGTVKRDILGSFELEAKQMSMDAEDDSFAGFDNQRRYEKAVRVLAYLEDVRTTRPEMMGTYDGQSDDDALDDSMASDYFDQCLNPNWRRWQKVQDPAYADDINLVQLAGSDYELPKNNSGYPNYSAVLLKEVDRKNLVKEVKYGRTIYTGIDMRPNQARLARERRHSYRTVVSPLLNDFKGLQDILYSVLSGLTHNDLKNVHGGPESIIYRSDIITTTFPAYWEDKDGNTDDLNVRSRLVVKKAGKRYDLWVCVHIPDINHLIPRVKPVNTKMLMVRIGMHEPGRYTMGGVLMRILEWKNKERRMNR